MNSSSLSTSNSASNVASISSLSSSNAASISSLSSSLPASASTPSQQSLSASPSPSSSSSLMASPGSSAPISSPSSSPNSSSPSPLLSSTPSSTQSSTQSSTPSSALISTPSSIQSSTPSSVTPSSTPSSVPLSSTPSSVPLSSTPSSVTPSSTPPTSSSPPSSSVPTTSSIPTSPSPSTLSQLVSSTPADDPPSSTPQAVSVETLRSTVLVTTTNSLGQTITSAPSAITSVVTFTSDGVPVTTTEIKINPTLGSDGSGSGTSSFFSNTGAVAGVFVVVGLAAASILLWSLLGVRRRRRNRRIAHDDAVTATLAAAGFHRAPLDDDGDGDRGFAASDMEMRSGSALALGTHTGSSLPSGGRLSGYQDDVVQDGYNPYREFGNTAPPEGYVPARTSSPPPTAYVEPYRDASGSGPEHRHYASQSVGSTEPLLASYNRRESPVSPAPSGAQLEPPTPPPRNPRRVLDQAPASPREQNGRRSTTSSVYSNESTGDDRLNPALRNSDIQDSEDYSRPVLGVRNMPDDVSQVSG